MSFITDIAALAKAGYTPQDVKELMQLSKPAENLQTEAQPAENKTEQTVLQFENSEPEKSTETAPKESAQPEDVPDYKALYEAEKEKVSTLQNKYNSMDVSQNATVNENDLLDAIRSFC